MFLFKGGGYDFFQPLQGGGHRKLLSAKGGFIDFCCLGLKNHPLSPAVNNDHSLNTNPFSVVTQPGFIPPGDMHVSFI